MSKSKNVCNADEEGSILKSEEALRYEKPVLVSFTSLPQGNAADCLAGSTPPEPLCDTGYDASPDCKVGYYAGDLCKAGVTAAVSCKTGSYAG